MAQSNVNRSGEELKQAKGVKAFFINDPAAAWREVSELSQVDRNKDGVIDSDDLRNLRSKKVVLSSGATLIELFTTHPNMLKRIKHLSVLNA
ncbi:MAG: hypothetical protein NTV30_08215 [Chloroflexi bacterium]|nr:hypothetical protein [Chloroflexota bacterium]